MLHEFGITNSDIDALKPEQLIDLRHTREFRKFVEAYSVFAAAVERTVSPSGYEGRTRIEGLVNGVGSELRRCLTSQGDRLKAFLKAEDVVATLTLGAAGMLSDHS